MHSEEILSRIIRYGKNMIRYFYKQPLQVYLQSGILADIKKIEDISSELHKRCSCKAESADKPDNIFYVR